MCAYVLLGEISLLAPCVCVLTGGLFAYDNNIRFSSGAELYDEAPIHAQPFQYCAFTVNRPCSQVFYLTLFFPTCKYIDFILDV